MIKKTLSEIFFLTAFFMQIHPAGFLNTITF